MHKVSRTLLLAGVLAFGTLTAACGDKVTVASNTGTVGVSQIQVTPPSATIAAGTSIQLAVSVTADATTAKTVTYTSSNSAVATVDATGKVTGIAAGTATITATSTADASKAAAAFITVTSTTATNTAGSIDISSVTDLAGNPVNLSNVNGQVNVTVNTSGGGLIEVFLSQNCTTNTIASTDVAVASQQATSAQAGQVTLSFNTAQLVQPGNTAARFPNGSFCVKTRLTNGASVVVATNTVPLTLNNANVFRGTLTFATQTGGPTSAVSGTNGLSYNQGTLTATVNPVIFTGSTATALISGYLTRNGEQNGTAGPIAPAAFTNVAVTNGVATITFPDTAGATTRSIYQYNSLPVGDTLYITSASDVAGNSIALAGGAAAQFATGATGTRIDNQSPALATSYTITAPNGYLGAAYAFSSGTTGTATDTRVAGVPGVNSVTTTYYVGAAGSTAFGTVNSCDLTGLTSALTAATLANSTATNANQAKVVVQDALGNKTCTDVASTFAGGLFGIDKIAPNVALVAGTTAQTPGTVASDLTGYNVSKLFSFTYGDTISGFDPLKPLQVSLVRNFGTSATAADCVVGTYTAASNSCAVVGSANPIEITGGTGIVGYYRITANAIDRAGNVSGTVTRIAAFDNVSPVLGAASATTATPLGSTTVTAAATDNFDLASSSGRLTYATLGTLPTPVAGFAQIGGTSFGPTFDATLVQSATASVTIPNVYRGLQSTSATGVILANAATPVAQVSVSDVGRNNALSSVAVATTTASANILTNNVDTLRIFPGNGTGSAYAPAATLATTSIIVQVVGSSSDAVFQSQPFATVTLYSLNARGELTAIASNTLAAVTDDAAGKRTYTYTFSNVALTAAAANSFFAIGNNAAGDAVISQAAVVQNP